MKMGSQIKNAACCLFFMLLAACSPDAKELASYLEGHWEGSHDSRRWCVTYINSNPEGNGGDIYYSMLDSNGDNAEEYQSYYGDWDALRGGRIDQLMQMKRKRYNSYLLFDLDENGYSYTSAHPDRRGDETFSNKRVESCPMHESLIQSRSALGN